MKVTPLPTHKASPFLIQNSSFLTLTHGNRALDLTPGFGENAFFLAKLGFNVEGVEPDRTKAQELARRAEQSGTHLKIIVGDPSRIQCLRERYQVVLCFYKIDRNVVLQIKRGLSPDGVVFMESYTRKQLDFSPVPDSVILKPKELQFFFKGYELLKYEERLEQGPKAVASIIARKPADSI